MKKHNLLALLMVTMCAPLCAENDRQVVPEFEDAQLVAQRFANVLGIQDPTTIDKNLVGSWFGQVSLEGEVSAAYVNTLREHEMTRFLLNSEKRSSAHGQELTIALDQLELELASKEELFGIRVFKKLNDPEYRDEHENWSSKRKTHWGWYAGGAIGLAVVVGCAGGITYYALTEKGSNGKRRRRRKKKRRSKNMTDAVFVSINGKDVDRGVIVDADVPAAIEINDPADMNKVKKIKIVSLTEAQELRGVQKSEQRDEVSLKKALGAYMEGNVLQADVFIDASDFASELSKLNAIFEHVKALNDCQTDKCYVRTIKEQGFFRALSKAIAKGCGICPKNKKEPGTTREEGNRSDSGLLSAGIDLGQEAPALKIAYLKRIGMVLEFMQHLQPLTKKRCRQNDIAVWITKLGWFELLMENNAPEVKISVETGNEDASSMFGEIREQWKQVRDRSNADLEAARDEFANMTTVSVEQILQFLKARNSQTKEDDLENADTGNEE